MRARAEFIIVWIAALLLAGCTSKGKTEEDAVLDPDLTMDDGDASEPEDASDLVDDEEGLDMAAEEACECDGGCDFDASGGGAVENVETPGLGSRITEDSFRSQFNGLVPEAG